MKTVMFLLGVADRNLFRTGEPINQTDFNLLNDVAERLDVQADIMFCIEDPEYAGRAKDVRVSTMKEHRPSVIRNILAAKPDVVVACGPLALQTLLNKGNVPLRDHLREDLDIPQLDGITCVASHSLEQISTRPGMDKWLVLDVNAALHGHTKTKWGKYKILLPGQPEWAQMPKELKGVKQVGLDLETYPGLNPWHPDARIRMCVVSDKVGRAWVVQARKDSKLPAWLRTIIEDPEVKCGGSNIKYDFKWLLRFGYHLTNMFDTSTAEHVLDCTNPMTDLKSLTFIYCAKLGDYSREHRRLVKQRGGWEYVEDNEQYQYCGGDGEASIAAMVGQQKKLKQQKLERPFALSMGLYRVLAGMEARGACVDVATNRDLDKLFAAELRQLRSQLTETLGPINPNSPAQLADALLALDVGIDLSKARLMRQLSGTYYKLKSDKADDDYSTDKEILEREAHKHPVIQTLLKYRKMAKLHGTYVTGLHEKHIAKHPDGLYYVHTSYRTDVVETYRLSSQGPNLQNVPRKPDPGEADILPAEFNIKRQYVSRFKNGCIIEADLSQAEIRIAAELSGDRLMLDAITSGEDLHQMMTAQFLNKPLNKVTKLERTHGKRQTFLVLYGGGANTLAKQIGVKKDKAKVLLRRYFDTYKQLDRYIQQVHLDVKRDLYSESIFGYRRRFRKPPAWNMYEGWRIERQAWNHQVQNGAACITFVAMMALQRMFDMEGFRSVIAMQVHDSIVIDTYPGEERDVALAAKACLEHPPLDLFGVELSVPLVADVEIGPSWGDTEKFVVD